MPNKDHVLTFRPNKDIVIATPLGLIKISRLSPKEARKNDPKGEADPRKIRISLPAGLRVGIGEEDALKDSPFLERTNGKIKPKFSLLVPKMKDGELVGVEAPDMISLTETS